MADATGTGDGPRAGRPFVVGVAGGIGAGKSEVARAFERLGCLVSDSDRDAKAALDLPEVRERLVAWWGDGILDAATGRVDRRAVAGVVFGDESQRLRLESLTHPIVHARRREVIERAGATGAPGVVVDAPLLFEAGVDAECDAVVFVDTNPEVRLGRVQRTRGWSREEWSRREAAQMGLEDKRGRCRFVIENDHTDSTELERAIAPIYAILRSEAAGTA